MDIRLLGKLNAPDIYTDMRDEGYILLAAVTLARTLPDSFAQVIWDSRLNVSTVQRMDGAARRAAYLADAENVAVNYFGRLQEADGSWLWRQWNRNRRSPRSSRDGSRRASPTRWSSPSWSASTWRRRSRSTG